MSNGTAMCLAVPFGLFFDLFFVGDVPLRVPALGFSFGLRRFYLGVHRQRVCPAGRAIFAISQRSKRNIGAAPLCTR